MSFEIRRKLYQRGSSYETTIPMPLLFAIDKAKKHNVVFSFDPAANKWFVKFEPVQKPANSKKNIDEVLK